MFPPTSLLSLVHTSNSSQDDACACNPGGGSDSKCSARIALASGGAVSTAAVGAVIGDQDEGACALLVGLAVAQALDDGLHHEAFGRISHRQNAVDSDIDFLREHCRDQK